MNGPLQSPLKLPDSVPECHEALVASHDKIAQLQAELAWYRNQMFGHKSEKMPPSADAQQDLFVGSQDAPASQDKDQETVCVPSHKRHKHGRRDLSSCENLPILERHVHDVPEDQKVCPCSRAKKKLPSKYTYQIGITRPKIFRIEHEICQYACELGCEGELVTAQKPMELLERCMADASLLAHVAVSKFADHLPLHRQEMMFGRIGIDLSRWTLCSWITKMGEQLSPLVEEMFRRIRNCRHAHVDETTMPVLAPGQTKTSYIWSVVGGNDAPYTVYRFTSGRGRAGPLEFLGLFRGILQSDAYVVYEQLTKTLKLTWAGCWAHVRRKFADAFKLCACHEAKEATDSIRDLYSVEREAKALTDEERCAVRREKAAPVIDRFFEWLEQQQFKCLPQSPMGKAVAYALNIRAQLRVYLDHGFVGIDNNPVERALRPVVVGRKNYMFAGNKAGGEAAATFYSIIESAKRHGLNVADYLEDVIRRLPSHRSDKFSELLPDKWRPIEPAVN